VPSGSAAVDRRKRIALTIFRTNQDRLRESFIPFDQLENLLPQQNWIGMVVEQNFE